MDLWRAGHMSHLRLSAVLLSSKALGSKLARDRGVGGEQRRAEEERK